MDSSSIQGMSWGGVGWGIIGAVLLEDKKETEYMGVRGKEKTAVQIRQNV